MPLVASPSPNAKKWKILICILTLFWFRIKEERLKKNSECVPDVLAWVNRSRKIEEKKNAEKEKALQLSKIFEEQVVCCKICICIVFKKADSIYTHVVFILQDNIVQGESDDEEADQQSTRMFPCI